jgi:hypothetical protein
LPLVEKVAAPIPELTKTLYLIDAQITTKTVVDSLNSETILRVEEDASLAVLDSLNEVHQGQYTNYVKIDLKADAKAHK